MCGYSPIPQTIPRSECSLPLLHDTNAHYQVPIRRIILASIRNLGRCPCTRCTIPLKQTHRLGMVSDRKNRVRLARVDDENRRDTVAKARAWMYKSHYSISNERVENLLGPLSFVPTRVRGLEVYLDR